MKALILNSGRGTRMGELTAHHPKCMTLLAKDETILSRQLRLLARCGISEIVVTTGPFEMTLKEHSIQTVAEIERGNGAHLRCAFVRNPDYAATNYIYSIYLARECLHDDILLMHGDLVFTEEVLTAVLNTPASCMTVSSTVPLPEKDFKAVLDHSRNRILKVGIEYFKNAVTAQPLYKLNRKDWEEWLAAICEYCESGKRTCYAENALNSVTEKSDITIRPFDVREQLCCEIDTPEDWQRVKQLLA